MGYKIRELRQKRNMTQEDLAKKSGVARTIISFLENGTKTQTTVKTLQRLAEALGVTVGDLFFAKND